jgi:hypothetical protein
MERQNGFPVDYESAGIFVMFGCALGNLGRYGGTPLC